MGPTELSMDILMPMPELIPMLMLVLMPDTPTVWLLTPTVLLSLLMSPLLLLPRLTTSPPMDFPTPPELPMPDLLPTPTVPLSLLSPPMLWLPVLTILLLTPALKRTI